MKLKKYFLIGMTALLVVVSCNNKKDNKNKEKVKVVGVKKDISKEEIKKYSEYLKISEEPNSEEWNDFFTEIKNNIHILDIRAKKTDKFPQSYFDILLNMVKRLVNAVLLIMFIYRIK